MKRKAAFVTTAAGVIFRLVPEMVMLSKVVTKDPGDAASSFWGPFTEISP